MSDFIENVPYNNPSLIPIGSYDIDIRMPIEIDLDNHGNFGSKKEGNYSIIHKVELEKGRELLMVDLVTLKKVLDKKGLYPEMKKNEVASLCQLTMVDDVVTVRGDIVKVTKHKK